MLYALFHVSLEEESMLFLDTDYGRDYSLIP